MANPARLFPAFVALMIFTLTSVAWGQSITLDNLGFGVERQEERTSQEFPLRISREDCLRGADGRYDPEIHGADGGDFTWVRITPTVNSAGLQNPFLQVYVSETADCTTQEARQGNSGVCRIVYSENATERNPEIFINPRDLVVREQALDFQQDEELPESICTDTSNQIDVAISIQLMIVTGADTIQASLEWTQTSLDLSAPAAPDGIDVGPGDEHLFFEWDIDSEAEDPETNGFTFFCVPAGTESNLGGAGGASSDVTVDAGGASSGSECAQEVLVAGELPNAQALDFECGEVAGRAARRGQADGLTNGVTYAVAVAATDVVRNSGALSDIQCLTPKEVTTFYEGYTEAGGKGGGGFCQSTPSNAGSLWWLSLLTGALLMLRRRRARS